LPRWQRGRSAVLEPRVTYSPFWPQKRFSRRNKAIHKGFDDRLALVRKSLRSRRAGGFLITHLINVRYLTGFSGSSGFALITGKKQVFVTDFRYKEQAAQEVRNWDIMIEKGNRLKTIKQLISSLSVGSLAFETSISYELYKALLKCGAGLRPLRNVVEVIRAVKGEEEISCIRKAVLKAEQAFLDVKRHVRSGRREREIALMLEERLKKKGCNVVPFDIIVASGTNSAMPHARATEKKLSPGDLVVIDWGGEANGYLSDMTRTLLLKGNDLSRKREIYEIVLRANREALSAVAPGIGGRDIDKAARDVIGAAGYGSFFGHGTGHGIGLEVHESPRITWTRSEAVKENMVFTIEPGIYIQGLGGVRIEDMVLVRPGKSEILTTLPKDPEVI
jgi:Xaa-Pro aminopeptidase